LVSKSCSMTMRNFMADFSRGQYIPKTDDSLPHSNKTEYVWWDTLKSFSWWLSDS
jgi:hypothetical protein